MEDSVVLRFDGGIGDILLVYEDKVVIQHKGLLNMMAMGMKGDKTIFISSITSIQLKKAGLTSGYLQFSLPGGNESRGGALKAMSDENSIAFNSKKNKEAEEIVNYLNNAIRQLRDSSSRGAAPSAADEIRKFKVLLDDGVITQAEFEQKKKQLLGL